MRRQQSAVVESAPQQLAVRSTGLSVLVSALPKLRTPSDLARASELYALAKQGIKDVHASQDPVCRATDAAHKEAVKARAELLGPWERAAAALDAMILEYQLRVKADTERITEAAREAARIEGEKIARERFRETGDAAEFQDHALRSLEDDTPSDLLPAIPTGIPSVALSDNSASLSRRRSFTFAITDPDHVSPDYLIPDLKAIQQIVTTLGFAAAEIVGGIKVEEQWGAASVRAKGISALIKEENGYDA